MQVVFHRMLWVSLAVCLFAFAGCGSTPQTQFYVLTPFSGLSSSDDLEFRKHESPVIGVAAVKLPEYLNRPQIVTRTSRNELALAEFDQWAGSLRENISSVVAANLSTFIPTDRISVFPAKLHSATDYEVFIDLIHFERDVRGQAVLLARWQIVARGGKTVLSAETSRYAEDVSQDGFDVTVAAMNRTLDSLSREIGEEIGALWRSQR